jgi:hypothetical protein
VKGSNGVDIGRGLPGGVSALRQVVRTPGANG